MAMSREKPGEGKLDIVPVYESFGNILEFRLF